MSSRAAANDYFPPLINLLILINRLIYKIEIEKMFIRAQGDVFKFLVLSEQQPRTQKYSVNSHIKQKEKQQIITFEELKPQNGHLCWMNRLNH